MAPESYPETYTPDDEKVEYTVTKDGAIFTKANDALVGTATQIEIKMDPDDTNVEVIMTVKNIGDAPKEFAVWSLSWEVFWLAQWWQFLQLLSRAQS